MTRLFALVSFFVLSSLPLAASAQRTCSASHVTTVEFLPQVTVHRGDATAEEPLASHLTAADQALAQAEILDLAHANFMYCAHQLRVHFVYDADAHEYQVSIGIRAPADRCWEQVQCGFILFHQEGGSRSPAGPTALAAVRDARAHAEGICTEMLISCPGDPPLH